MIPIQAAIGGKIIARETIKGFKKDVLTKIHGGGALDRKRKLLEKQKKGKARAKQFGKVEIPQEAFIGVLKISKESWFFGEVAERLKAHAWKACKGETLSWVRIPFSPPLNKPYFSSIICAF